MTETSKESSVKEHTLEKDSELRFEIDTSKINVTVEVSFINFCNFQHFNYVNTFNFS
jgi:hypothetical protein